MKHRQRSNKDCKEKIQFHHFEDRISFHQSTRHVLELYKMDTQHYTHDDDDDDDDYTHKNNAGQRIYNRLPFVVGPYIHFARLPCDGG